MYESSFYLSVTFARIHFDPELNPNSQSNYNSNPNLDSKPDSNLSLILTLTSCKKNACAKVMTRAKVTLVQRCLVKK